MSKRFAFSVRLCSLRNLLLMAQQKPALNAVLENANSAIQSSKGAVSSKSIALGNVCINQEKGLSRFGYRKIVEGSQEPTISISEINMVGFLILSGVKRFSREIIGLAKFVDRLGDDFKQTILSHTKNFQNFVLNCQMGEHFAFHVTRKLLPMGGLNTGMGKREVFDFKCPLCRININIPSVRKD